MLIPILAFAALTGLCAQTFAQGVVPPPLNDPGLAESAPLQNPRSALEVFPVDREKRPDWVETLRSGLIEPRETLRGGARTQEAMGGAPRSGIVFTNTREMPHVVFPHQPHIEWLACANCHDSLFARTATGRGIGMAAILAGSHCGVCHGRVAFSPEGSCYRCHSLPHPNSLIQALPASAAGQPATSVVDPSSEADDGPKRRRGGGAAIGDRRSPIYPSKSQ